MVALTKNKITVSFISYGFVFTNTLDMYKSIQTLSKTFVVSLFQTVYLHDSVAPHSGLINADVSKFSG